MRFIERGGDDLDLFSGFIRGDRSGVQFANEKFPIRVEGQVHRDIQPGSEGNGLDPSKEDFPDNRNKKGVTACPGVPFRHPFVVDADLEANILTARRRG